MRSSILVASSLALGAVALPPAINRRELVTEVVVETVTITEWVTVDYDEPTSTSNSLSASSATSWSANGPTSSALTPEPPRLAPPPGLTTAPRPVAAPSSSSRILPSSPSRVSSPAPVIPAPARSSNSIPIQSPPPSIKNAASSPPVQKPASNGLFPWPFPYRPSTVVRTTSRPASPVPIATSTRRIVPPSSSRVVPPVQSPPSQQPSSSRFTPPVQPSSQPRPVASSPPVQAPSSQLPQPAASSRPAPAPAPASSSFLVPAPQPSAPSNQHTPGQSQAYLSSGPEYRAAVLYHHNAARANHGASELTWDAECEANALIAAQRCTFDHYIPPGVREGQNLFTVSGTAFNVTAGITESWYKSELPPMIPYFGKSDVPDDVFHSVGHLTQLVWKGTERVGCVSVDCGSRMVVGGQLSTMNKYTVCNYAPPGNVVGRYAQNVAPPMSYQNLGGWAD